MPRYKRTADEAQLDLPVEPELPPESQEMLTSLRNMWEFASLMQYIFLFGHAVKIDDDFDIEDLEAECLKTPSSERLAQIGLQLLKYVSSHRGLTLDIFDEYTRRQYLAKAPQRNPFGEDEEPIKFGDLDVYTRIKVLQQLSTWTLGNVDRMRGLMPQDEDHLNWRMDPLGWDRADSSYYVLDDNRLYKRSDAPLPPPSPKSRTKSKAKNKMMRSGRSRATRVSKRRKIEDSDDEDNEGKSEVEDAEDDTILGNGELSQQDQEPSYGFTSKTWECVAITLDEYQDFMASIFRSRDPNEKALRSRIEEDVLPIIEKRAEGLRQKQLKKVRELENLQKMATAKRSSRLADKAEKDKQEREEREAEDKRKADLRMAHEEQERQRRIEEGHESRRLTREQRVREREAKRILHEEELARLEEEDGRDSSQGVDHEAGDAKRASERQRKTQLDQHKKELERLAEDEGNWYFDCSVCGKHGENMDDGTHSIACDKCNVWQHSKCHGFSHKQAESETFTFVCGTCKRKEEDAKKPKIPPLKLSNRSSGSPEQQKSASRPASANTESKNQLPDHVTRQLDSLSSIQAGRPSPSPGPFAQITNRHGVSPQVQIPAGIGYPPISNFAPHPPQPPWQGNPYPSSSRGSYTGGHQQQHYLAHEHAVVSAGGHPNYYQNGQRHAQPQQANGYTSNVPGAPYAQQYPHDQHKYRGAQQQQEHTQYQQPQQSPQPTSQHHGQHAQRPGSSHLMNGFQSPEKAAAKTLSPSPGVQQTPDRFQQEASPHPQKVHHSPNTYLPPPAPQHRPLQSPVKSSPQYPKPALTPNGSALQAGQLRTPQTQRSGSGASSQASRTHNVAADGMSGPWPEESKVVPQKHDQSPAPPASAQSISEKKVFPPNTPLIPSPGPPSAVGPDSIPVKKLGATPSAQPNGSPSSS